MTEQAVADSDALVFTSAAAKKVSELIAEEGNPELMLRIYVQGGGCSGFQYGFTFDENVNEGDERIVTDGVSLLIDPMSLLTVSGDTQVLQGMVNTTLDDGIFQVVGLHVKGNGLLTSPARRAGREIGFSVAVLVKGLFNFGTFEIVQGLDVVLFRILFGYQIPLESAGLYDVTDLLRLFGKIFGGLGVVHGEPAVGPVVHIAQGHRFVKNGVLQVFGGFGLVA